MVTAEKVLLGRSIIMMNPGTIADIHNSFIPGEAVAILMSHSMKNAKMIRSDPSAVKIYAKYTIEDHSLFRSVPICAHSFENVRNGLKTREIKTRQIAANYCFLKGIL